MCRTRTNINYILLSSLAIGPLANEDVILFTCWVFINDKQHDKLFKAIKIISTLLLKFLIKSTFIQSKRMNYIRKYEK